MTQLINKLFLAIILISLFTYFERADYNLPLFAFAYFLWNHHKPLQKTRLWYLITFSTVVDLIWIFYWAVFWNRQDFKAHNGTKTTSLTVFLSAVNILLKVISIVYLFVKEPDCKRAVHQIVPNIRSVFVYSAGYDEM